MKTLDTILRSLDGPVVAGSSARRDRFIEQLRAAQRENTHELRKCQVLLAGCILFALVAGGTTIVHSDARTVVLGALLAFASACALRMIALWRALAALNILVVIAPELGDEGLRELLDALMNWLLGKQGHDRVKGKGKGRKKSASSGGSA